MDVIAKRGSFGDFGHVRKGKVLKGVSKGQAEKLIASGCYVEATPDAIKEFEKSRQAAKKRNASEPASLKIGIDAAALEKMFGEHRAALDAFKEGIAAEINQMKERLEAGLAQASELAGLKDAIAGVAQKVEALSANSEGAGGAGGKAS